MTGSDVAMADNRGTDLIHNMVALQARRRPQAIAVRHNEQALTYATLDANAEAYAAALAEFGAGPGVVIPVVLPPTPSFLVALLAVLKTGAAYAALDHRWPQQHINALIDRLAPPVVVSDTETPAGPTVWKPPDVTESPAVDREWPPPRDLTGDMPAMVFFTSGTTGKPKGVLSPHLATLRLFGSETFAEFGPGSAMPLTAPVPWDAFALETWGMLTTGGTLVLPAEEYFLPDTLRELISAAGVTQTWLTASLFNLFVDEDLAAFRGLRRVLTGGEKLSPRHVRRFLAAHPDIPLVNGYGPVESCVFVSTHLVRPEDCDRADGIPIGRPVAGTGLHILDGTCPTTGPGEICVSGTGLALKYLNAPDDTARAFVTVSLNGESIRLYRTGDRGELDQDGVLQFRGRIDDQVKVAGHRIEPAEIEFTVRSLPGIRDCAVYTVADPTGQDRRLALSYVSEPAQDITEATVKHSLDARLPVYQVPSVIRRHAHLPRTPNGKVDRASLAAQLTAAPMPQ